MHASPRLALVAAAGILAVAAPAAARVTTDPLQGQEWFLGAVGASPELAPGPGIPLTIVDSGVDQTQPDLAGRPDTTYLNEQTITGPEGYHGTEVASVAAAPANGIGIVGVYPQATLAIWDATPGPTGVLGPDAAAGIDAAQCPGVVLLSWGAPVRDPVLERAVLRAQRRGCLVVAAAGNAGAAGNPEMFPAAYPHVLAIGATDKSNHVAVSSSFGAWVDLVAPGVDIPVDTTVDRAAAGTTVEQGTSFAAAIAGAAAAWVWTARPALSAAQVFELLRATATRLGAKTPDPVAGYGLLNLRAALDAPAPPRDPGEPNDDVDEVKAGGLSPAGATPLTTAAHPSGRVAATLTAVKDPRDVYRIWVPPHRTVRIALRTTSGAAAARIWGPRTVSVDESGAARRRDLRGTVVRGGGAGFDAYVEVRLTRTASAVYTLGVTAG